MEKKKLSLKELFKIAKGEESGCCNIEESKNSCCDSKETSATCCDPTKEEIGCCQ